MIITFNSLKCLVDEIEKAGYLIDTPIEINVVRECDDVVIRESIVATIHNKHTSDVSFTLSSKIKSI